ncbi:hypothetical protein HOO65_020622 [Ceratocystis lukuohia]|uniref:Uncharacterized protein n=1 Tax=Ceratocystis lukuohia TaxID=2019550 RepID=A0ABR4MP57_9PEZI
MHVSAIFAASALMAVASGAPIPMSHRRALTEPQYLIQPARNLPESIPIMSPVSSTSLCTDSTSVVSTASPTVTAVSSDPWAPSSLSTSVIFRSPTTLSTATASRLASSPTSIPIPTGSRSTVMRAGPAYDPAEYRAPVRSASPSGRWLTWSAGPLVPLSSYTRSSPTATAASSPISALSTPTSTSGPNFGSSSTSMTSAVSLSAPTAPVETYPATSQWRPLTASSSLPQSKGNSVSLSNSTALTTSHVTSTSLIPITTALASSIPTTEDPAKANLLAALSIPQHTITASPLSSSITSIISTTTVFVTYSTANLTVSADLTAAPQFSSGSAFGTAINTISTSTAIDGWRSFRGNYSLLWSSLSPASPSPAPLTALPTAVYGSPMLSGGGSAKSIALASATQAPSWPSGTLSAPTAAATASPTVTDIVADITVTSTKTITVIPTPAGVTKTNPVRLYGEYPLLCIELRGNRTVPSVIPSELLEFLQDS